VLDETGIDGKFKFKLEYQPFEAQEKVGLALQGIPVADDDPRPSIFTAIKSQLGRKLSPGRGLCQRLYRPD